MARVFVKEVVSKHSWPDEIVMDRDKLFVSRFWQALMKELDVKHKLSTAYHPQTDGQTERMNQVVEAYLRSYVNFE